MDKRVINEEYAVIGRQIIEEEPSLADLRMSNAQVVFLSSQRRKHANGKKTYAECEKISDKYKWGIPADFTITVFEPNCAGFTDEQMRILLFHELLHARVEVREDGTEIYGINPHDLEDFKEIIDRFGTDWDAV